MKKCVFWNFWNPSVGIGYFLFHLYIFGVFSCRNGLDILVDIRGWSVGDIMVAIMVIKMVIMSGLIGIWGVDSVPSFVAHFV